MLAIVFTIIFEVKITLFLANITLLQKSFWFNIPTKIFYSNIFFAPVWKIVFIRVQSLKHDFNWEL